LNGPTPGEVYICGQATSNLNDDARTAMRRNQIGFVYQFHHLLPEFSALENLVLPQMIAGLDRKEAEQRAAELLAYLRIDGARASPARGTVRRRAAARRHCSRRRERASGAAGRRTDGNLDPKTAGHVFEALKSLVRESGLAALIATHNFSLAADMDRTITIEEGAIVPANLG
jgi:lipoprotein-releasing system ATP-binding protein